ncbi:MAG TPA: glycerol-3-phosphate 1-O-acyltransferase PlsY [Clostridia bacterium]|nr:glycerol-3-phosphate 1-O-acyltransferase PlsY [Clostridia bacterium]
MPDFTIILPFFLTAVAAYLIGSLSFSIIITRLLTNTDVREHGSGNAGATNVLRTAGKGPALLTFALDFLKCVVSIILALYFFGLFTGVGVDMMFIRFTGGLFCLLGHAFPLYFGFKGGKGVTTSAALVFMINWKCFLILLGVFFIVLLITKIVSLSSMIGISFFPAATLLIEYLDHAPAFYLAVNTFFALLIAGLVVLRHRKNIIRLKNGTESKIVQ